MCKAQWDFKYPFNYKFTKKSSVKNFLNRLRFDRIRVMSLWPTVLAHPVDRVVWRAVCSVWDSGVRQAAKACMLKLANHRRWFDTIVIYVLHTFQFYLNDSVRASVMSAVNDGMNLTTANLDCVILNSLKKQVNCLSLPTISSSSSPKKVPVRQQLRTECATNLGLL